MSTTPKIVVVKMREIIYTLVLIFLALLLVLCLVMMFRPKSSKTDSSATRQSDTASSEKAASTYTPGVYTTSLTLGSEAVDVAVSVDADHINSIRLVNLSESTAAMYPLVSPALEHITSQILDTQQLEGITCSQENKYTSQLLLGAISSSLERAKEKQ